MYYGGFTNTLVHYGTLSPSPSQHILHSSAHITPEVSSCREHADGRKCGRGRQAVVCVRYTVCVMLWGVCLAYCMLVERGCLCACCGCIGSLLEMPLALLWSRNEIYHIRGIHLQLPHRYPSVLSSVLPPLTLLSCLILESVTSIPF